MFLVVLDFLDFGLFNAGHDGSSRIEVTFEFGLELDFFGVTFSKVLIIGSNVGIAGRLKFIVGSIGFLLFSNISVFQIMKSADQGIKRISSLELEEDGIE